MNDDDFLRPPSLTTVGGVRQILSGERTLSIERDTPIAVEDPDGVIRRLSGFAMRDVDGVMTVVLTLGL